MAVRLAELDTIIFDLGNVIVDLNPHLVLERFKDLSEADSKDIPELIKDTELLIEYETGRMTTPEFIDATNQFLGTTISEQDFTSAWNLMIGNIPQRRLEFIHQLRKTHQVLILSNTNEMHEIYFEDVVRKNFSVSGFDHYVDVPLYSHLIGLRKPALNIYEYVIDKYLTDPSKALFLDDKIENVEAAMEAGLQSEQVKYPDQIFEILADE